MLEFGLTRDHVLWARVGIVMSGIHAGLRPDLRRTNSRPPVIVGLYGVVQEQCVLIEVVFRFGYRDTGCLLEPVLWSL